MIRRGNLLFATLAGTLAVTHPVHATVFAFIDQPMTGTQEGPPVATSGFGTFSGLYDNTTRTLLFNVTWQLGNGATVTASHFHAPAPIGQSAPIVIPVGGLSPTTAGQFSGSVVLDATQESQLLGGTMYFNIHSTAFPNGELRAQLIENSATDANVRFDPATGILTLPAVLVPQVGGFSAQLQLVPNSNPPVFSVNGVTQTR